MASIPVNDLGRWLVALAMALGIGGCTEAPALFLGVQLVTDLRPGDEFTTIEVAVAGGSTRRTKATAPDYLTPRRVADFGGLKKSARRRVTIRLLDSQNREVLGRSVELEQRDSTTRTIALTRNCIGVKCSAPASSCLGSVCVDPRCTDGSGGRCAEPSCKTDADCPVSACERASCRLGTCLATPDPGVCVDVDAGPSSDAGPRDAGAKDASQADAGSDAGNPPTCDGGICRLDASCASFRNGTHRYWLCPIPLIWGDASAFCAADGAHLVTIESKIEGQPIAERIALSSGLTGNRAPHFIGLSDHTLKGTYRWIGRIPLTYENWAFNEPSNSKTELCGEENCGVMFASGLWGDACCAVAQRFICEADTP